jgi:hypothetical protein
VARSVVKRATSVVARSWGSRARLRELATMAASSAADDDARRVGDKRGFRRQVGGNCVVEVEGEVGLDSQVGQPVPRARPGGLAAGICTPCCKGWHRFQASFRWAWFCAFWRLGLRQSSFRHITRAHRLLAPYAWARETARMACYCPLRLSSPGRPLGPGISPPIPPHCVGDISGRLVAQTDKPLLYLRKPSKFQQNRLHTDGYQFDCQPVLSVAGRPEPAPRLSRQSANIMCAPCQNRRSSDQVAISADSALGVEGKRLAELAHSSTS